MKVLSELACNSHFGFYYRFVQNFPIPKNIPTSMEMNVLNIGRFISIAATAHAVIIANWLT